MAELKALLLVRLATWCLLLLQIESTPASSAASSATSIHCIPRERDALLAFRTELNDPSNNLSSWQGKVCCRCSEDVNSSIGFQGAQVNSLLLGLEQLRSLDLSGNNFNGTTIPEFIGGLKNLRLQYLDLSGVNLSIAIDWAQVVNKLSSLVTLNLNFCGLKNTMPFPVQDNLTSLEHLDLGGNDFSAPIGAKNIFWNLPSLLRLEMWNCGLQGSIPEEVGNMTSIVRLYLQENNLTGTIPTTFGKLHNLEELFLYANKISGPVSVLLHRLPGNNLSQLILFENNLTGNLPDQLGHLGNLTILDLKNNRLSGEVPLGRGALTHLKELRLSFNNLDENQIARMLPTTLFQEMEAESIDFSDNLLVGPMPKLPRKLVSLDISRNNLSGPLPSDFGAPLLGALILFKNSITGRIPHHFCQLDHLDFVDLSANRLHGAFPDCEEQHKTGNSTRNKNNSSNIIMMNLNTNNLSGEFPVFLHKCQRLIFLELSYNQFSGILPTWIGERLPSLALLSLRSNSFVGGIPQQFGKMKMWTHFGTSPIMAGALMRLMWCNIGPGLNRIDRIFLATSCNFFSGSPIPRNSKVKRVWLGAIWGWVTDKWARIGTLHVVFYPDSSLVITKGQQLEFTTGIIYLVNFDLSCNSFTGYIPEEIGKLTALKNLNLSWNHLRPRLAVVEHKPQVIQTTWGSGDSPPTTPSTSTSGFDPYT
ncbi:hypothetical protein ACP4OV_011521 [Aristida adscensionis]